MMRAVAGGLALIAGLSVSAQQHPHPPATASKTAAVDKVGTVTFPNSCADAAKAPFTRGVALLHSFEFSMAIASFDAALAADPSCAIADWGIALSRWNNPMAAGNRSTALLAAGRQAVDRAKAAQAKTDRERGYIDAVSQLYDDF